MSQNFISKVLIINHTCGIKSMKNNAIYIYLLKVIPFYNGTVGDLYRTSQVIFSFTFKFASPTQTTALLT